MQDINLIVITLSDEQKVEVLLKALEERYKSIHIIRDRVQSICLWILGLFITAAGWLLQSTHFVTSNEKWYFSAMILISVIVLKAYYLNDLEKGFKTQQKIQANIEQVLGLCKKGVFSEESIYPSVWANAGTKNGSGKFFFHNYLLIYLATFFLVTSIWLS